MIGTGYIVRSDSGLGHTRERTGTFFILVGIWGNFEAARRRVMGSWSRGGGRRLYRGEVGCRVELKNFLDRSSITLLIYGPIYLFTRKTNV